MHLNELAKQVNVTAHRKGWYIHPRSFGDIIALFHSEITEVFEEWRAGGSITGVSAKTDSTEYLVAHANKDDWKEFERMASQGYKPEGVPIELADVIIRILDFCAENGIDIGAAVSTKMVYNETRAFRHGGKRI